MSRNDSAFRLILPFPEPIKIEIANGGEMSNGN